MAGDQQVMTVAGMRELAKKYEDNALKAREISNFLERQFTNLFWQSDAASSFKQHMAEYRQALRNLDTHFTNLAHDVKERANLTETSQKSPV